MAAPPHFGTPFHTFRGHRKKLHPRSQWRNSHVGVAPVSAHPSHVSWPHRELHLRSHSSHVGVAPVSAHPSHVSVAQQGAPPKAPVTQFAYGRRPRFGTPLTRFAAPLGAPRKGSSRAVRMCASPPLRYTPHTFRGPIGNSTTEGANASAQTWASPPFRHTLDVFRGPIGGFT